MSVPTRLLAAAAKATEGSHEQPFTADYVETFILLYPEEFEAHGHALSRRSLNGEFRTYFHRLAQTLSDDEDDEAPAQFELDLPAPAEGYLLVKYQRDFRPVRIERARESDWLGSIEYGDVQIGHISRKNTNKRKNLAFLRTLPGFAGDERTTGEVLRARVPESV